MGNGDKINPEGLEGEKLAPPIEERTTLTARQVKDTLKDAIEEGEAAVIDEVRIEDPKQALANMEAAFGVMKKHFPVKEDDVLFGQLSGQAVGEALGGGKIQGDPYILMLPANRIPWVLIHEENHADGLVENEALVEARTRKMLKSSGMLSEGESGEFTTEKYNTAVENFELFAKRISGGKAVADDVIEEVYNLYYNGKYEKIYELYEENYMSTFDTDKEKDKAFELFEAVFPELEVTENGVFETYDIDEEETTAESEEEPAKPASVITDIAAKADSAVEGDQKEEERAA